MPSSGRFETVSRMRQHSARAERRRVRLAARLTEGNAKAPGRIDAIALNPVLKPRLRNRLQTADADFDTRAVRRVRRKIVIGDRLSQASRERLTTLQ